MKRALLFLAALSLTACGPVRLPCAITRGCPQPTPTEVPPDPRPTPTPMPQATPTPVPTSTASPTPTAAPTPSANACTLPPGTGDGIDCPRTSSRLLAHVDSAIGETLMLHPEWLESPTVVRAGAEDAFRLQVVDELRRVGLCAFFDGEEVAVKDSNAFSEQYQILSSARNIRRGEGSYRATCTPAWSAIPATVATPEPPPTPAAVETCPCLVAVTVAFLGVNDGPPPVLHAGDSITLDSTYRLARGAGDGRGAPSDQIEGRNCTPPRGPDWETDMPDGVQQRSVNAGYGLRLVSLKAGRYRVSVTQPSNLTDGESPARAISACPWPAGGSVRSVLEFEVGQ